MKKKIALITGVTGQDGSYLLEFLLEKGYEVHGLKRRASSFNTQRIDHLYQDPHLEQPKFILHEDNVNFFLHYGDLSDGLNLVGLIRKIKPDEIYNLAAMSHVSVSFEIPEYSANINALGTLRVLEAVRQLGLQNKTKIYQASSSELYGKVQETPQNEKTPFYPRSPYAASKLYSYWIIVNYREAYNIFASNGILFNHESPVRGETFVTRKITRAVASIALGKKDKFYLGNLDSKRDWGHAKDYVKMMWMILQHDKPDDWVISTGRTVTVRDFVLKSFKVLGIEIEFKGTGLSEVGIVKKCNNKEFDLPVGKEILGIDKKYYRPTEVDLLVGDSSKAKKELGWECHYTLEDLIKEMVLSDYNLLKIK